MAKYYENVMPVRCFNFIVFDKDYFLDILYEFERIINGHFSFSNSQFTRATSSYFLLADGLHLYIFL